MRARGEGGGSSPARAQITAVIPEAAKRLSGIQKHKHAYLDSGLAGFARAPE
jgi:hypothetical protein